MTKHAERSPDQIRREIEALELHPTTRAAERTDDLLRKLLASPPDPHIAAKKPAKRTPKKPSKKK